VKQRTAITRTNYAGNYVYENDALQFFSQPEGYVEPNSSAYNYIYQYKDHLGNVRLSYKDISLTSTPSLQIVEENNYYPFGLKHKGYNNLQNGRDHNFGFGNKEEQDELGLSWIDITARNYDPALGRWMNVDPAAEVFYELTPYRYAFNNPINVIDTDGNIEWPLKGTYVVQKNASEYIENQEVYSRGRGWIVQSGKFESSRTTDEYKLYTNSPNQNAIIRTSQWNIRRKSTEKNSMTSPHIGTDFRAKIGTNIYSLGDGTVISADREKGNLVVEYANGDRVTFRHLNSIEEFRNGGVVYEGQIIAQSGKRKTRNPHLHIDAVSNTGQQVNIEDREYGSVTNELFFGEFKGDYKKLKAYNEGVKNGDIKSHKQKDYTSEEWKKLIDNLINN